MSGFLLWMDMEMSGLEPERDRVLEVATIITSADLEVIAEGPDLVVFQSDEVLAAMDLARLTNDLPQLPNGLDTVVGEKGATLSGGQRQRTAIARALVRRPRLLILDDSLASVDANTASQILGGLQQLAQPNGRADRRVRPTVIIVAQRMGTVRHADTIVVLHDGRVAEQGSHDELLALDGRYDELYRRELMQAEEAIDED